MPYTPSTRVLKPYWVIFGGYAPIPQKRAGDKKLAYIVIEIP